ncbi:MAG: aspartate kinase [Myxococcota bacterium]|nr:aspartate kinase [Myxococcota bacterium]
MSIVVQKYGGSSVSTPAAIKAVATRIVATREAGHQLVVVVSAMGDSTNQLLSLAREISDTPPRRELDMLVTVGERISMALLSMAIQELGLPAVSFTGSQSGIITTEDHSNARIVEVRPHRIRAALAEGKIVIVAGFQGVSRSLEITSLGRGGSDTSAVALAAALGAAWVEICSDVDGVYNADPRIRPRASRIAELSYEEMQALSDSGAKVLHAEAVEWARRAGVEIRCVATHRPGGGTRVRGRDEAYTPRLVGLSQRKGLLYVSGVEGAMNELSVILQAQGATASLLESSEHGTRLLIPLDELHDRRALEETLRAYGDHDLRIDDQFEELSLIGRRLLSGGFLQRVLTLLGEAELSPHEQSWGTHQIRFLFHRDEAKRASDLLFEQFFSHLPASPSPTR